jgi:hypothetical protein
MADSSSGLPSATVRRTARRPYLYWGQHSPHYYLAIAGVLGGVVCAVLNVWAYYDEGMILTHIAFDAVVTTTVILFLAFFWGCFLLMSGTIPTRRLRYVLFHATLGTLSPLIFSLSISAELPTLNTQPIGDLEVYLGFVSVIVLVVQFLSGWSVLDRRPWRILMRQSSR